MHHLNNVQEQFAKLRRKSVFMVMADDDETWYIKNTAPYSPPIDFFVLKRSKVNEVIF